MMSLDERVALLRRVRFFAGAPPEALPRVAAAMEPLALPAGAPLFQKGELGDCLYVIVAGRVMVHDGELLFNHLCAGDVVGELAALDAELRSASVTAVEDTALLRLHQAPLFDLLMAHADVAHGVISVLCRHLRARVVDVANDYAYIRVVGQIAAAARAMEAGGFRAGQLAEVARRDDALGDLARVFEHMAARVQARERRLRAEVQELRIEIDRARQERQVSAIIGSDYFRQLQQRAASLRAALDDEALRTDELGGWHGAPPAGNDL
jgi:CRP-like cAMP-binding protein